MKPYKSISSSHTLAMEGPSSAQSRLIHFIPFLLSSLGSSSSPPIQNVSTVTPQEGELPGKDTVATEGWSLLDFTKLQLGCPGSSSSSSPTQNANGATNQQRDLLGELPGKDTVAMEGWSLLDFTKLQLGCPGSSSSSSPTQNANGETNQQRDLLGELPGKDTVAMEGWSLLDFTKLQLGCPGSSSSSSPTQNANGETNQQRDLLVASSHGHCWQQRLRIATPTGWG